MLLVTKCTQGCFTFPAVKRRQVEAEFSDDDITNDGGLLLLRQADKRLGLLEAVNAPPSVISVTCSVINCLCCGRGYTACARDMKT